MVIGNKLTKTVAQAVGCRFLGQHWPDADVRWNGECFLANCRVCGSQLRRVGPGIWSEQADVPKPTADQGGPFAFARTVSSPPANLANAAQSILDAIAMLDELAPGDPYALAAIRHAEHALDALIENPIDQLPMKSQAVN